VPTAQTLALSATLLRALREGVLHYLEEEEEEDARLLERGCDNDERIFLHQTAHERRVSLAAVAASGGEDALSAASSCGSLFDASTQLPPAELTPPAAATGAAARRPSALAFVRSGRRLSPAARLPAPAAPGGLQVPHAMRRASVEPPGGTAATGTVFSV